MPTFQCGGPADLTAQGLSSAWANLGTAVDYTMPRFTNWFKQARPWQDEAMAYSPQQMVSGGYVTPGGSIISLPSGVTSLSTFIYLYTGEQDFIPLSSLAYLSDTMTLSFDGSATIVVSGAGVSGVSYTAQGATFSFDATASSATIQMVVTPTNPSDWPRNWRLIPSGHAADYAAGKIFMQDMLADMSVFAGVRFMDFGATNASPLVDWSNRPILTDEYWTGWRQAPSGSMTRQGVPVEAMVAFCQEADVHGWFCVPHAATDDYMQSMATLLRDTMPAGKKICIEYSNETWNFSGAFEQTPWCYNAGNDLWGGGGGSENEWTGYRSTQMAEIFTAVFAGQERRLLRILATQTATDTTPTSTRLNAADWLAASPGEWVSPASVHDYIAVTGYFGGSVLSNNAAAIVTALGVSQASALTLILETYCPDLMETTKASMAAHMALAASYGLKTCVYETNQHIDVRQALATSLYSGGSPIAGLLDMIEALYLDARTEAFKQDIADNFKSNGGTFHCYFGDYANTSQYGGWWWKRYAGDTTTGATGLAAWVAANPRWFHY